MRWTNSKCHERLHSRGNSAVVAQPHNVFHWPNFPKINLFSQLVELRFFVGTLQMRRDRLDPAKRIGDSEEAVDLFVNRLGNSGGSEVIDDALV
jgi:hypothetical protein